MNTINNTTIKTVEIFQKDLTASGLVLQAYGNAILQQPEVDFSSEPDLVRLQEDINRSLVIAKRHANSFLNTTNIKIINSLSALNNYFTVYKTVPTTLPEGFTENQWLAVLAAVKSIAEKNLKNSEFIVDELEELRDNLNADSDTFSAIAKSANEAVAGDNGELEAIGDAIADINSELRGIRFEIAGEALLIAGGVITIIVGATASGITGFQSGLAIAGGAVVVIEAGVALSESVISMTNLYQQKTALFQKESKLKSEIKMLAGIDSVFRDLSSQAETAAIAAKEMTNTWKSLTKELNSLIADLSNGILSTAQVRELFLNQANNEIADLQDTINTIRQQMSGIVTVTLPEGETVQSYLEVVA